MLFLNKYIERIVSLVEQGKIVKITYSFEINIDLEGKPQFWPVVHGNGWRFYPLATKQFTVSDVSEEDVQLLTRAFPAASTFIWTEKRYVALFDKLFDVLSRKGLTVSHGKDSSQEPGYNMYGCAHG